MPPFEFRTPPTRPLLGGDLLAQSLSHLGTTLCFGLHGGHLDAFLVGCAFTVPPIRLIDTRHETPAIQAAESYAKLTRTVGIAFVTANSGFCNALPGLATAFADRSPVFIITSSPPLRDAETNALQGFHDQVVLAQPMSKFAHRVTCVEEIPRIVSFAMRTALAGTPGPVVVDFPIDVLFSPPRSLQALGLGGLGMESARPPAPEPEGLRRLVGLWGAAERPVLVVGTGAGGLTTGVGGKANRLVELAEEMQTPVFYSSKFAPAFPQESVLRGGPATRLAVLPYIGAKRPDLVILLGARTGFLLGGRSHAIIPEDSTIVQIDMDGAEIGRSLPVSLGLVSDAEVFVDAFLKHVRGEKAKKPQTGEWLEVVKGLRALPSKYEKEDTKVSDGLLHPWHALKAVFESLPKDSIVLIDGGEAGVWALDLLEHARAAHAMASTGYRHALKRRSWAISRVDPPPPPPPSGVPFPPLSPNACFPITDNPTVGHLGNGWGYSLGAALAFPDRVIVNIQGDGSAGFHIQELDSYARHGCNVLTVVVNNYFWGMSVAGQDIMYEKSETVRPVSTLSKDCRYDIVAQGFGCQGRLVEEFGDVAKATKEIVDCKGPGLINLIVSRQPVTDTTKSMVGQTDDTDVIVVPYYDNIPKPYYKEKEDKTNGAV